MSGSDLPTEETPKQRQRRNVTAALVAVAGLALVVLGPAALALAWYDPPAPSGRITFPHRIGDPVPDGPVTFVIHEVRCGAAEDGVAQGQLCEVTLGARNDGRQEVTVPSHAQTLHVSQGARHLPVAEGTGELGTLAPREARTALIRYDLPMGVTITHLELRAGTYARGVPVAVDTPYPLLDRD